MANGFFNDVMVAKNVNFNVDGSDNSTVLSDGQLLIGSSVSPNIRVGTLTAGTGINIVNANGSITISNSGSVNDLHVAKWIVNPLGVSAGANQTTIQAAINAASSGDTIFVMPGNTGIYTENLTLKAGVNLTAFGCDSSLNGTGRVIIKGTCTLTTAGTVTISGIQLETNSAALLAVTGTLASVVNLQNCFLNCTNNTGITYSSSSGSSGIILSSCFGNLGTTGIGYYTATSAGSIAIKNSTLNNSGSSLTASSNSSGTIFIQNSTGNFVISTSSTGMFAISNSNLDTVAINTTTLTTAGSGISSIFNSNLASGTASCASIGTGTTLQLLNCIVNSTNTNAITGAGIVTYSGLTFLNSAIIVNTTTQTNVGTLIGVRAGNSPSAGFLGEQIRSGVVVGSAVTLSTNVTYNITTITLSAGIWDVSAIIAFTGTTGTAFGGSVTLVSGGTGQAGDNQTSSTQSPVAGQADTNLIIPSFRFTVSVNTIIYLTGLSVFAAGTMKAYGRISGTRVG